MTLNEFKRQVEKNVGMELVTLAEFGDALGYHPKMVARFCKEGRIQSMVIQNRSGTPQTFIPHSELERVKKDGSIPSRI